MKRNLFLTISLLVLTTLSFAQQRFPLSGTVTDTDGMSIIAATVSVDGTTRGAITDEDGKFSIDVSAGETLIVSYIGYEDYSFVVSDTRTTIDVELASETQAVSEVVVVGYGTQRREAVVGAVADVSGANIRNTGLTNLTHAIQDALPGVTATVSSGQPGGEDADLTVRGVSTFSGSNKPLILVDEIEVSGGFAAINPSEIASISVLKDASATAVYGSRGANGVILITTRRGSESVPRITVSGSITAKTPAKLPDQVGAYDALMLGQDAAKNSGSFGAVRSQSYINEYLNPNRDQIYYPDVDWYKELVNNIGWEESASVSISGGSKNVKYFSSLSYDHVGDIMNVTNINDTYDPRYDFKKFNFRTNLDIALTRTTNLRVDLSGRSSTKNTPNEIFTTDAQNLFGNINSYPSYLMPMYYTAEFLQKYPDPYDPDAYLKGDRIAGIMDYRTPYYDLNYYGYNVYTSQVADFKVGLDQDLSMITKGLKLYGTFNYSTNYTYSKAFNWLSLAGGDDKTHPIYYYNVATDSWEGTAYNEQIAPYHPNSEEAFKSVNRNIFYEGKLAYNRTFGGVHNVGAVGVFNRTIYYGAISEFPAYLENWVGRATYDYDSRYFVEVNAAYNGSDKFAVGKRFGFFPSMALGWNIANERFVKDNVSFVNEFKVRYSAGISGSEGSAADFMYEGGWKAIDSMWYSIWNDGYPWSDPSTRYYEYQIANAFATWEKAYKYNFGIDAKFFKNSLSVTLDIYNETRKDILVAQPIGSMFHPGVAWKYNVSLPKTNDGEMKSRGMELVLGYRGRINTDWSYNVGANVAFAESLVVTRSDYAYAEEYIKNAGKPFGWIKGYKTAGFVTSFEEQINSINTDAYATGGTQPGTYIYADYNMDGLIDADDRVPLEGTSNPNYVYGFNLGVTYKQFTLSTRFYGKAGVWYAANLKYIYPIADHEHIVAREEHLGNLWSYDNQNAQYPVMMSYTKNPSYNTNSSNLVNGAYLKLKSVQLRYAISSPRLQEKAGIQNLSVYLTGDNLFSWDNLPYGDPEGGNAVSGAGSYPLVRRYVLGLDFNF